MPSMVDPSRALVSLQEEHRKGHVLWITGAVHPDLHGTVDFPEGQMRITYAKIKADRVYGMVEAIVSQPVKGLPCVQIAYAVTKSQRRRQTSRPSASRRERFRADRKRLRIQRQGSPHLSI